MGEFVQVTDRDRSTLRHHGPCLTCRAGNIQYGRGNGRGLAGPHVTNGDLWLERRLAAPMAKTSKPFHFVGPTEALYDPEGRQRTAPGVARHQVAYEISSVWEYESSGRAGGDIASINGISYWLLKPYVCSTCQSEIETEISKRIENARPRLARERQEARYEATWRRPRPGEFAVASGSRKFALVAPTLSLRTIEFRWRTSKWFCRGSSPAFVMLMTVSGILSGRCYRTYGVITHHDEDPFSQFEEEAEEVEAEEYAATLLLTKWIQRNLQEGLTSADPLFAWDASKPPAPSCWYRNSAGPGVIQTTWVDGTRFAVLVDFHKIPQVVVFLEKVGYRLIEQTDQPGAASKPSPGGTACS
jgi:hypothetical protein